MKSLVIAAVAVTFAAVPVTKSLHQDPQPAPATEQHQWLQQLVGDWTIQFEAVSAPDTEPMKSKGTESTRAIGALWVVSDLTGEMGGSKMQAAMTLGYDPDKKAFIGTWIDSMQTHMWHYVGQLDAAKKVLTLSAKGPSFDDPTKQANYHDIITIVDKDTRLLTSEVEGPDGKWMQFMKAEYKRKK